ncbi:hypothetical protein AAFF_G00429790, partial [Aldrovandia affinis]
MHPFTCRPYHPVDLLLLPVCVVLYSRGSTREKLSLTDRQWRGMGRCGGATSGCSKGVGFGSTLPSGSL